MFSVPILWIICFIDGMPEIDDRIIWVYLPALPLETIAILAYIKALSLSPLSLTTPFLSFTPVFLLITSPVMLGEYPSLFGISGIMIIVLGAYTLNLHSMRTGLLNPFKNILREKGSLLMLLVAFLYSLTSNYGKLGVLYSSPSFFAASHYTLLGIILFFILLKRSGIKAILKKELAVIAVMSSIMISFHMTAIELIYVSYMISVKRGSLLFGILFGVIFLKEKGFKEKILGGMLMIAGIFIISWFSK